MYFRPKTIEEVPHGCQCFHDAVEHGVILESETQSVWPDSEPAEMNLSSIQTKLIQLTGRFCEHYASDLLCELATLQAFIMLSPITKADRWVIPIGIRECGVDHEAFIISRLKSSNPLSDSLSEPVNHVYRKLLALDITDTPGEDRYAAFRSINLVDITNSFHRLSPDTSSVA